jgi:hypothetical protein
MKKISLVLLFSMVYAASPLLISGASLFATENNLYHQNQQDVQRRYGNSNRSSYFQTNGSYYYSPNYNSTPNSSYNSYNQQYNNNNNYSNPNNSSYQYNSDYNNGYNNGY